MGQLGAQVGALATEVRELVSWQRGVKGLREGERYEARIGRRGTAIFQGGRGGSTSELWVRQHVEDLLARWPLTEDIDEKDDPLEADVIWWKDGAYALVEVSRTVDETDVQRAHERAQILRGAGEAKGVRAVLPVVIGQTWDQKRVKAQDQEVGIRELTEHLGVAWWVGDDLAAPLVEYRRLALGR